MKCRDQLKDYEQTEKRIEKLTIELEISGKR